MKKNQTKWEPYSGSNNLQLSGIPSSISDEGLENMIIKICKELRVDVKVRDIEGYHWLPLSRNSRSHNKRVIVKIFNWKNAEALLNNKKRMASMCQAFVSASRFSWVKCKDRQKQGKVHNVFCRGGVVYIKLSENGSPVKLLHISDILDFPSVSNIKYQFL